MNDWDNTQANEEGWALYPWSKQISVYWVTREKLRSAKTPKIPIFEQWVEIAIAHVEAKAKEGSAYHIEALARHYFCE